MSLKRLCREWIALLAILAMALGPLALATSRGLSARERVNVAAGLQALPLCHPGDAIDGLSGKPGGACEHCLPVVGSAPAGPLPVAALFVLSSRIGPAPGHPSAPPAPIRLPPATGPPLS